MNILLKFQYKNKWYFVERDNKDIKYYTITNSIKDYNLNSSEIELIKSIMLKVIPSNDRIKLVDFQYKNNTYEISLDKINNYYLFSPKPSYKDFIELNYLFNNMNESVFTGERLKMPEEDKSFIKRIITIGSKVFIILVSAQLLLVPSANYFANMYDIKYDNHAYVSYVSSTEYTQSLSNQELINIVINAVNNNTNLTDEEKNKILNYLIPELIIDNKEYMDIEYLEETLSNIKIKYKEKSKEDIINGFASGRYNPKTKTITFNGVSRINDINETTFTHEVFHSAGKYDYIGFNSFLVETTNTIFNEEYTGEKEESIYTYYYNFTKALMEIIGSEPLKEYHNYTSPRPIVNALCEITGDENDALRLLHNLNIYKKLYDPETITINRKNNIDKTKKEIINQLEIYYSAKYNISTEDDLVMLYYLYEKKFNEKLKEMIDSMDLPENYDYDFRVVDNNIKYFNKNDDKEKGIIVSIYKRRAEMYNGIYYDAEGNKITKEEYDRLFNTRKENCIEQVDNSDISDDNIEFIINNDNRYLNTNNQVRVKRKL